MTELAYVDNANLPWARRWLRSVPGRKAVLLAAPDALETIRAFATEYTEVEEVIPVCERGDETSERLQYFLREHRIQEVTLPRALPTYRFDYFPHDHCPDLRPLYPLLQWLRGLGIQRFRLYGPAGEFSVQIPCLLDSYRDRHKGQRCFIVGNGPSLNDIDMTRLKEEITFGSNRCYLGYENWGFPFTYWGICDEYQIHEYAHEYEASIPGETEKFCPLRYLPLLQMDHLCPVEIAPCAGPRRFSAQEPLGAGHSVSYMLLQLAVAMGCNPIILIGMDHRYDLAESRPARAGRDIRESLVRPLRSTFLYHAVRSWRERSRAQAPSLPMNGPSLWDASMSKGKTHFHDAYTKGVAKKFALPQPREAEKDYRCANKVSQQQGIKILNATPNSKLTIFQTVPYDTLFS